MKKKNDVKIDLHNPEFVKKLNEIADKSGHSPKYYKMKALLSGQIEKKINEAREKSS